VIGRGSRARPSDSSPPPNNDKRAAPDAIERPPRPRQEEDSVTAREIKPPRPPRARTSRLNPGAALPGQWEEPKPVKTPRTLGQRLLTAVGSGRKLPHIRAEIQAGGVLELDESTLRAVIERLETEARERDALARALVIHLEEGEEGAGR